jgi:uncharacterized membrane protein
MLQLHIVASFAALGLFLVPLLTRKGGAVHRWVGWAFLLAMGISSATGTLFGVQHFLERGRPTDLFFIFIGVWMFTTGWFGIRVLRFKNRTDRHSNIIDLAPCILQLGASVMVAVVGFTSGIPVLVLLGVLAFFLGLDQWNYWRKAPTEPLHWLPVHISAMFTLIIGGLTAFLVQGVQRYLPGQSLNPFWWFLPAILLVPLNLWMEKHYTRKFQPAESATSTEPAGI